MKLIRRIACTLSVAMAACLPAAGQGLDPPGATAGAERTPRVDRQDLARWLDGFMPYALAEGDIAGAVVAVVGPDGVIAKKGYGYADVEAGRPVDPDATLFRPGSISKLVTWTAVMQLVERGLVDLDADVAAYLDFQVPDGGEPVTLRDILTHTTGFEDRVKGLIVTDPADLVGMEEYLRSWIPRQIAPPGSVPSYSNYATGLAGLVVEKVSGLSFEDYARQHVFGPLGMSRSTFRQPLPPQLQADMSQGYARSTLPPRPYELLAVNATGGLASSGGDVARFMQMFLQHGRYGDTRILSTDSVEQMFTAGRVFLPPLNRVALGFFENTIDGRRVISHGGDTQWFYSWMHLFPEQEIGLFVSFNSAGRQRAAYDLSWGFLEDFVERFLPAPDAAGEPAWLDGEEALEYARLLASHSYRYSIRFQSSHMRFLQLLAPTWIVINDDHTISASGVNGANGQPKRWRAVAPYVWKQVDGPYRLAARVESGRLEYWSHDQLSPHAVYEPYPGPFPPHWMRPALALALLVLVVATVSWPAGAILRLRYPGLRDRPPALVRATRVSRAGAAVLLGVFMAWVLHFVAMSADSSLLFQPPNMLLRVLYGGSVLGLAATGAVGWGAVLRLRAGPGGSARAWSLALCLAALVVVCAMFEYGLFSFELEY